MGLATGSDNGWYTLRIGELKAMLALAGGDLEQALVWTEWTMEFNSSVFSPERANYYRCLQTLLLLAQEEDRQPLQYLNAFVRMYGADAVEAASAAMSGEAAFYGLQPVDSDLRVCCTSVVVEGLRKAAARQSSILGKIKSNSLRNVGLMISLSYITGRFLMPRFTYICINKIIVIIRLNIGNLYLINTIDIVTLFA